MSGRAGGGLRRWLTGWGLWRNRPPVLAYVLTINAVAVLTSVATGFVRPITSTELIRFAVLVGCAAAYIELTREVERHREYLRSTAAAYIDTKSVWSFAAVLILPPVLATAMVIVTYAIAWLRIWPHERPVPLYRWVFSCATVLIATVTAVTAPSVRPVRKLTSTRWPSE